MVDSLAFDQVKVPVLYYLNNLVRKMWIWMMAEAIKMRLLCVESASRPVLSCSDGEFC